MQNIFCIQIFTINDTLCIGAPANNICIAGGLNGEISLDNADANAD